MQSSKKMSQCPRTGRSASEEKRRFSYHLQLTCESSVSNKENPEAYILISQPGLRILTGEKHRRIKLQRLQKVRIRIFGSFVHQINSL